MILRVAALVAFIVAAVLCIVVSAPDIYNILAAISIGLALWVGATLTVGRLP